METPDTILAAGGLVSRDLNGSRRIAVVHRNRHNDWTLPKGKCELGEQLDQTAAREVFEETGCDVRLVRFATTVGYYVGGSWKTVFYWHMTPKSEPAFKASDEVDAVEWLDPGEAIKRLTYPSERELVRREFLSGANRSPALHLTWWQRIARQLWRTMPARRLQSALLAYVPELELRIACFHDQPYPDRFWAEAARDLVARAFDALHRDAPEDGWHCLMAAQRLECFALYDGEIESKAASLQLESEKLHGWRKAAVQKLLESPAPVRLYEALFHRDEQAQNHWHKIAVRKRQLQLLLGVLFVVIIASVFLAGAAANEPSASPLLLGTVALLGAAGACLGAILSLARDPLASRIPEQVASTAITVMRPAIGAAAALGMYFLLAARISTGVPDPGASGLFAVAFASGFSERLFIKGVESIGGKHASG